MIIAVDVDGVIADLHTEWLARYNRDYGTSMMCSDITQWDIHKIVVPECGHKIFDYLDNADLYEKIEPYPAARGAVEVMRQKGDRVVFLTSCGEHNMGQKWRWLVRHGFLPESRIQKDLIIANDKSLLRADFLVDDYHENLQSWGARGILIDAPYNQTAPDYGFTRVHDWGGVLSVIYG